MRVRSALLAFAILSLPAGIIAMPALADWPTFGRALCTAPGDQLGPVIASDGSGGAIVAWHDRRSFPFNIDTEHVLAPVVVLRRRRQWDPGFDRPELHAGRHHADDRVGLAVDRHRPARRERVRPETALPQAVAEDGDLRRPRRVVAGHEAAAARRADAEHVEEVGGDRGGVHRLRLAGPRQVAAQVHVEVQIVLQDQAEVRGAGGRRRTRSGRWLGGRWRHRPGLRGRRRLSRPRALPGPGHTARL